MLMRLGSSSQSFTMLLGATLGIIALAVPSARADIIGFNNGVGWTANSDGALPVFSGNSVQMTDNGGNEHRSVFFNTRQSIGTFNAQFTYTPSGARAADGATFILQTIGPNALSTGNGGSGLGIQGLAPSAEVEFNIFGGHTIGTNYEINGANSTFYHSTLPVVLNSGDPIQVTLKYDGATLSEHLLDTVTSATFDISYVTNIPAVLGSGTAFVGFTGSTGGAVSIQTFSDFQYTVPATTIPEPSTIALVGIGMLGLLALRRSRRRAI